MLIASYNKLEKIAPLASSKNFTFLPKKEREEKLSLAHVVVNNHSIVVVTFLIKASMSGDTATNRPAVHLMLDAHNAYTGKKMRLKVYNQGKHCCS